jgi:HD-like signal output (HDOD) protein
MKILFVDDEANILQGIERALFHRDEWDIVTAKSGAEALELLEEEGDFDIIVSDMRMPLMGGIELLTQIQSRYPHIVRVVLSGQANPTEMLGIVPMAHRCLAKSCPPGMLEEVIYELSVLSRFVHDPDLRKLAAQVKELPSLPSLYRELAEAVNDPYRELASIGTIVEKDPGVSAKLLQVVNAPFFGMKHPSKSVSEAVVRLGTNAVCTIVLAMETFRMAPQVRSGVVDVRSIQERSFRAAVLARNLSPDREQGGAAFMAALLQDVGILLLLTTDHESYQEAWRDAGSDYAKAESDAGLVTHAQLGAYLLALWGLPAEVVEAVRCHHHPQSAVEPSFLVDVVYIATCLVEGRAPDETYIESAGLSSLLESALVAVDD